MLLFLLVWADIDDGLCLLCADSDNRGGSEVSRIVGPVAPQRKSRVDEFLNSENEKSDYDW